MMLKPTTLFAGCMLVMVATQVRADTEHYNYNLRSMPKKFCGRILADTLSIVCEGNYNGHMNKKSGRPEDDRFNSDDYLSFEQQLDEPTFPFRSRSNAMRLKFRRTVRGITNECCEKSCTYNELRSYCAPPTDRPSNYYPYSTKTRKIKKLAPQCTRLENTQIKNSRN
ncbi:LIRP-like [Ctenocephalides felis]|uniref:LIRP-like n=1 Tax=Ctenocephalides felis TaxID=7515 RepID=UPI000E6E5848|nr:LIRP-like [Ctenocephalides felis]